jgi:mRNA interferase MazF
LTNTNKERQNLTIIKQGDIYWVPIRESDELESEIIHPHVVIQENDITQNKTTTVVVCALTTNIKKSNIPGNVLLERGEANLPKKSMVLVSQMTSVAVSTLGEYIGSVTKERINQIMNGIELQQIIIDSNRHKKTE